jgi:hypothetical protein
MCQIIKIRLVSAIQCFFVYPYNQIQNFTTLFYERLIRVKGLWESQEYVDCAPTTSWKLFPLRPVTHLQRR